MTRAKYQPLRGRVRPAPTGSLSEKKERSKTFNTEPKPDPKIISLSHEDRRILAYPTLKSQMPFSFPVTNFTLTTVTCNCVNCDKEIADHALYAELTQHFNGQTLIVDARGICTECNLVSRFYFNVDWNGKIRWKDGNKDITSKVYVQDDDFWLLKVRSVFTRLFLAFF